MAVQTIERFVKRVVTAQPQESLGNVARLMDTHNVGAVVLVDGGQPKGILTDRDLALALGARSKSLQAPAQEVMTAPVEVVYLDAGIFDTTQAMKQARVRRLVVVDNDGNVAGIVTLDDLLRVLSVELSNLIQGIAQEMAVK